MIGIEIDNSIVELPADAKVSLKLSNPLFNDDDIIPGDYSLPFDLVTPEDSPDNAAILNHPDVVENPVPKRKQDCKILFDGVAYQSGKIINHQVGDKMQMSFLGGLNTYPDFKTLKLRDLMDELITIDGSSITKKIYAKPITAAADYSLTVNGKTYTSSSGVIATALAEISSQIDLDYPYAANSSEYVPCSYVENSVASPNGIAAPYLVIYPGRKYISLGFDTILASTDPLHALSVTVEDNGVAPNYNWAVEADLGAYYTNFDSFLAGYLNGSYPTNKFRFPVAFNEGAGDDTGTYKTGIAVNVSAGGTITRNNPNYTFTSRLDVSNVNSLQPFVMLSYILGKAATRFGFSYGGDWTTDPDVVSMLVYNANPLDYPIDFVGNKKFLFWKRSFNLKDLVPDITFVEYLKAFQNRYNLKISLDAKTQTLYIKKREVIAKSVVKVDISSKSSIIKPLEDDTLTGIRLEASKETDDLHATLDQYDVDVVEQSIKTDMASLRTSTIVNGFEGILVSQKKSDKFALRVFYYKGLVSNGFLSLDYPQALPDAEAYLDQYDDGALPGLYSTCWKYWLNQRIRRKAATLLVSFELADLMNLDMDVKQRYDRNDYFIFSLDVDLTNKAIAPVKAILYKC